MKYLLDTDVIIDFSYKKNPSYSLIQQIDQDDLHISVITWSELLFGLKSQRNTKAIEALVLFVQDLNISILPIDKAVAEQYVDLQIKLKRNLLSQADLLIGATALKHNLTLVTRNIKHFRRIPDIRLV